MGWPVLASTNLGVDDGARFAVDHFDRSTCGMFFCCGEQPVFTEPPHGGKHIEERQTFWSQRIFVARGIRLVCTLIEQFFVDQAGESFCEGSPGTIESLLDLFEPAHAVSDFAQHDWRPPVTHKVGSAGDGAGWTFLSEF